LDQNNKIYTSFEVADILAASVEDSFSEQDLEAFLARPDHEQIKHVYLHSDCDFFAVALLEIFDYKICGVTTEHGPIHRLVQNESNQYIDASGFVTEEDLKKRYAAKQLNISKGGDESLAIGFSGDEEDIQLAAVSMLYLPWMPFTDNIDKILQYIKSHAD
jgi:hypothetical protein